MNRIIITIFFTVFNLQQIACVNPKDIKAEIAQMTVDDNAITNKRIKDIANVILTVDYYNFDEVNFTSEQLIDLITKYYDKSASEIEKAKKDLEADEIRILNFFSGNFELYTLELYVLEHISFEIKLEKRMKFSMLLVLAGIFGYFFYSLITYFSTSENSAQPEI